MKTLFLINPGSGRKPSPHKVSKVIQQEYSKAGQEAAIWTIDFPKLDQQIETAINKGFENIYAVGGDGTVNAIGIRLSQKPINFGVIPNGSGNGYARNLGFSIQTRVAVRQSLDAFSLKVDMATFNNTAFLNVAGLGLDAAVALQFSQRKKRGLGAYIRSSAQELVKFKPQGYSLRIDGIEYTYPEAGGVMIANGTQWGYDAKVNPHASITDGRLDILVLKKFPLVKAGALVGKIFNGKLPQSKYIDLLYGKKVEIARESEGVAHIDGEPIQVGKEVTIQVIEKCINLLVPNTLTLKKIQSL